MRSFLYNLIGLVVTLTLFTTQLAAQYYYSHGQQLPISIDSNKISIKFETSIGQDDQTNIINSIGRIVSILTEYNPIDNFVNCSLSTGVSYNDFLDSVQLIDGVHLVEPFYATIDNEPLLVGDRFCAAFETHVSSDIIDSINSEFNVEFEYILDTTGNVYVLRNTPLSGYRMLDLANAYFELTETRYAHPLFGIRMELNAYKVFDHYNPYQPHIKRVIGQFNVASVWDFAGLEQIRTIAVLDDGVSDSEEVHGNIAHEDLPHMRVLPGANFKNWVIGPNPPSPSSGDYHGMACAGIIGASHTFDSLFGLDSNSGVISIAPHVQIMPVKVFENNVPTVNDSFVLAINYAWQNGADVLSNSWGVGFPCPSGIDVITEAINNAFYFGRGGKGCAVIFSSGNSSPFAVQWPACLTTVMSVGAVKLNDSLWNYSQYGDSLDLVAPSGDVGGQGDFYSTDQNGKNGVNSPGGNFNCQPGLPEDGDYICNFGGTSAAAPIVAGIAALILSKDENLTAPEVYEILRYSAVTELASDTISAPDEQYGYGRVDAFRAILSISRGDLNNDGAIGNINDLTFLVKSCSTAGRCRSQAL